MGTAVNRRAFNRRAELGLFGPGEIELADGRAWGPRDAWQTSAVGWLENAPHTAVTAAIGSKDAAFAGHEGQPTYIVSERKPYLLI